jgi:hypothetical protein
MKRFSFARVSEGGEEVPRTLSEYRPHWEAFAVDPLAPSEAPPEPVTITTSSRGATRLELLHGRVDVLGEFALLASYAVPRKWTIPSADAPLEEQVAVLREYLARLVHQHQGVRVSNVPSGPVPSLPWRVPPRGDGGLEALQRRVAVLDEFVDAAQARHNMALDAAPQGDDLAALRLRIARFQDCAVQLSDECYLVVDERTRVDLRGSLPWMEQEFGPL